jgi:hypothetical protein
MIISLIIGFLPHVYAAVYPPNPSNIIPVLCKIRGYVGQSFAMIYRWLMTMACIDRYMASSSNVYLREFANPRIAYSIIIKIFLICIILPIHNLIFLNVQTNLCMYPSTATILYHSLFTFTLGGFLPILIMTISAVLIQKNLASNRARRQRNIRRPNEKQTVRLISARDQQVLVMLFIQILFYILSTIPWMIFLLYGPYTHRYHLTNKSTNRIIIERFIMYLTEITVYLYPALSFYIYTLTSRTFRGELLNIIYTLLTYRYRSRDSPQSLLMQPETYWKNQLGQSTQIIDVQPIEIEMFLDSSPKDDLFIEETIRNSSN